MKKIIECVPNFSEGRDQTIINAIAEAIRNTKGVTLLDVDPGKSTNRTVYTFVGDEETIIEGALAGARIAKEKIDMRTHKGEHPRFGAMDVCPFIPVANVTMEECAEISKKFAKRAGEELNVPFFLYEEASDRDYRKKLPDVRKGEYEALEERLKYPEWTPDFGPSEFVPTWGATATGARMFLIAYNVNILGTSNQAHRIALDLREAGRGKNQPGKLKDVKGMGWFVDEYNMAQVTVNLNNYNVTPIHVLFEEVKKGAEELNIAVAGSEIVGIVPLESLLMAAEYYIEKEELFIYQEEQKVRLAIERLGLNSVAPFNPKEKIIEYIVAEAPDEPLATMSVRGFIEEISARTSAPGGGSASAAMAAIGTGLGAMVAKLTQGVRKFEHKEAQMQAVIPILHDLTQSLIPMIDKDTSAFNEYMEGLRMPKSTDEEKAARKTKMQAGLKTAIQVPLNTMCLGDKAWDALITTAEHSNPASKSDVQVGAKALETGIWGAFQNVLINMADIEDEDFKAETLAQAQTMEQRSRRKCAQVLAILDKI
ncbi:glutamate formimidoyltransferase [Desulfotignum phosphitoxidans]|uniref:Formimidoyltransferase-cyclodeaminase n=1 Tax=Desulfotignum phosphitoxidans DSM 13687 TaxID=1286635 RepID=S0FXJ9_9BACT|nr:glutamate formimidoyltransferase [Desulfotignum phosphitoxidans]EMS77894.1 glutamate formiminotransferase / formiminotetrahydrofolate cyclodeaminase FtcD [Desulfotignum phosphitoxidans DSM 13687]